MKKVCTQCQQDWDNERDFSWRNKKLGIRQTRCKYCVAKSSKTHYESNKPAYFERAHNRNNKIHLEHQYKIREYLRAHPCVDCGNTDIRVLDFDHVRGKKLNNISRMIGECYSWSTIEAEIAKCEVRCGNCHRIRTNKGRAWWSFFLNEDGDAPVTHTLSDMA